MEGMSVLTEEFVSVQQVETEDQLRDRVAQFAERLGFRTVDAIAVVDGRDGRSCFRSVGVTPAAYADDHVEFDNCRRDPVSQHCRDRNTPIVWNQETYTRSGLGAKWEAQACHGYRTGIALALHFPGGRHFSIGVDRDEELPPNPEEITRLVSELSLFAVQAADAALRVLFPMALKERPSLRPSLQLSRRELEALKWTMEGKTAWEVGGILGISEQTAARHLHHATRKLDCVNKHHAVVKALRLGLIE